MRASQDEHGHEHGRRDGGGALRAGMARRRLLAVVTAVAVVYMPVAVFGPASPASAADKYRTDECIDGYRNVTVPEGVNLMVAYAVGAAGGTHSGGHGANGGNGGIVQATVPVTPGETISVGVGCQGHADGGWGGAGAHGGDHGYAFDFGGDYSGPGGGGATSVERKDEMLVMAGGGGGGGGYGDTKQGLHHDGRGGDGGHPPETGKAGVNNFSGQYAAPGCGGCADGREGHDGGKSHEGGGGGGGGGGWKGGGGGQGGLKGTDHPHPRGGDGAGGGGGSSWVTDDAVDVRFGSANDSQQGKDGAGLVVLTWLEVEPSSVEAYGGAGQDTPAGTEFADPLQVRVESKDGYPVAGAQVTFDVSGEDSDGPGGAFEDEDGDAGGTSVSVDTGADGIAESPKLLANGHVGGWEATASVEGVDDPAKFGMTNEKAASSTTGSVETDSPVAGGEVSFSAVVDGGDVGGTPTGEVKFSFEEDGPTQTVDLDDGEASWTFSPDQTDKESWVPAGGHTMYIDYSGDDDFAPGQAAVPFTIEKIPTDVKVSSEPNPSVVNQQVSVTAKVSVPDDMPVPVGGTVEFRVDGDTVGTAKVSAGGAASVELPGDLTTGEYTVKAALAGDDWYAASTGSMVQQVGADATAVEVSTSPEPSQYGEPVTLNATVRPNDAGGVTPTGEVRFTTGETELCTATVDDDGQAQCESSTTLDPGDHTISAEFVSGDDDFEDGSGQSEHTVAKHATGVTVSVAPDQTVTGQPATMRAGVDWEGIDPAAGVGTVQFLVDDTKVGGPVEITDPHGIVQADLPTDVGAGTHTITAKYRGSSVFESSADHGTHTVSTADTETGVTASPEPSDPGQAVEFTATVDPVDPGSGVPAGVVQFRVDGDDVGDPVALDGQGMAISAPVDTMDSAGGHDVDAVFEADSRDYGDSSGTLTHQVTEATVTTVHSSDNPSLLGEQVEVTARVLPQAGDPVDAGTVDFSAGGDPVSACQDMPVDGAAAECTLPELPVGEQTIKATYSGTEEFAGSTGTVTQQIQTQTETKLASSVNPSEHGQKVDFTATVTQPQRDGAAPGGGKVQFRIDQSPVGDPVAINQQGQASLDDVAELSAGGHQVTADYLGGTRYLPSSDTVTQTVGEATSPSSPDGGGQDTSPSGHNDAGDSGTDDSGTSNVGASEALLPNTGSPVGLLAGIVALLLLTAGTGLLWANRRRNRDGGTPPELN